MPADQETIRYTGVYGDDLDGAAVPDARGARRRLRRPLLRRRRGHHPRGARLAEPADGVHRGPVPVPRRAARAGRRLAAAPGRYRGGLGYEKHIRMLRDAHFMSIADRSILACWGVRGGKAGRPFEVVDRPRRAERAGGRRAGRRRAGPGRRGDPDPHHRRRRLGRPARPALRRGAARRARGARCRSRARATTTASVLRRAGEPVVDEPASDALRAERSAGRRRAEPFFDRGPGYATLSGGRRSAECDWL